MQSDIGMLFVVIGISTCILTHVIKLNIKNKNCKIPRGIAGHHTTQKN
jgi:hypothetical protein